MKLTQERKESMLSLALTMYDKPLKEVNAYYDGSTHERMVEELVYYWHESAFPVLEAISKPINMKTKDFLSHCTACGGNWGGMLLSGVRKLKPEVYDAIPDDMGPFAFTAICTVLELLGVNLDE